MLLSVLVGILVFLAGTQYGVMAYIAPGVAITKIFRLRSHQHFIGLMPRA